MAKLDSIKEKATAAEDFARKIWLAGLGVYGKGYDEAKGRFEELNSDAAKVFDDLVAKGEKLEADAKDLFNETKTEIKDKTSELNEKAESNIKERVADVREKLGMDKTDADDKIDELSAKIDALTSIVEKLSAK